MYDLKDSDLKETNLFKSFLYNLPLSENIKLYNDFIDNHRSKDKSTEFPSIYTHEDYKYSLDPESKSIQVGIKYLNDTSKSQKINNEQTTSDQTSQDNDKLQEQHYDESVFIHKSIKDHNHSLVEWQFDGEKLIDDPKLFHGYNRQTWFIEFGDWFQLPLDVQNTLTYQFNNNNEIGYFFFKGDKYRILFDKNLALCTKKGNTYTYRIKNTPPKFL